MSTTTIPDLASPTPAESQSAREISRHLAQYVNQPLPIQLPHVDGAVELPPPAVRLLIELFSAMAEGDTVILFPRHAELTTQQAADLLNVSRPFLIKQLEEGKIQYRKVGKHRRVRISDLQAYKAETDRACREAIDGLVEQAQELDMGY